MQKQPPKYLTRFYGKTEYALEVLTQKQIAFIHANKLNDPFDPYFFFETDFAEDYSALIKHINKHHPHDMPWFIQHIPIKNWHQAVQDLKDTLKCWRSGMHVLSMCSECINLHPKHNLYMWGHYGNGHRGIAIEFDTAALSQAVVAENEAVKGARVGVNEVWAEILYEDKLPPLTCEIFFEFFKAEYERNRSKRQRARRTKLDEFYELMGCIKSKAWDREHEWRLMWNNNEVKTGVYKCHIGGDAIHAIYLGLSLPEQTQNEFVISEIIRNYPQAKIYRAKKLLGDFALDFEPISP